MRRTWLGLLDPIDEEKSLDSSERILQGSQLNTWRKKKKSIFASSLVKRSLNYMSLGNDSLQLNEETEAGVVSVWGQDEVLLKQSEEGSK